MTFPGGARLFFQILAAQLFESVVRGSSCTQTLLNFGLWHGIWTCIYIYIYKCQSDS